MHAQWRKGRHGAGDPRASGRPHIDRPDQSLTIPHRLALHDEGLAGALSLSHQPVAFRTIAG